eukprot:TRINITY_DN2957_c0_g2_i5.p1 TRINITY_DN2957_c0_g2~~TRINITY_DN2957_c0_g2_i5.p1  ORF type:complete len:779 (-),score=230.88 TRINITY_DN2957_c0_g2_i5:26-2362(-)
MYKDRFIAYVKSQTGMDADLIDFTNQVADTLGYTFPVTFTLPLRTALIPLYFIRLFLDQIFLFVVVVLIVLGGMLIYSLLLSNVEEKTYEYGMLRAMGMKQYVLIELLTTQSLSFSVPAILIGLTVSFLLYIPVAGYISDFSLSPIDITMTPRAGLLATILGLIMPLVSIVGPIRRALSRTLRDALDIYHQVQSETSVSITKLEDLGLSPWQVTASLMMVVMGFVVYYIIPYAFTFGNLPLFFTILILILLGMLFGLSLIGTTLQPFAERLCIYILLWGSDYRALSELVRKNLAAHGRRNIKTATMFTTALAFIIFAGASFALQGHTIGETVQLATGADIVVYGGLTRSAMGMLNEDPMRNYLNEMLSAPNPLITGFTFITPPLSNVKYTRQTRISNLAGYPNTRINIYGVEENYLDQTYVRFFRPSEVSSQFSYKKTSDGKDNVVSSLYTEAGKATLPLEEGGIRVPPDITSAPKNDPGNSTAQADAVINEAYKDYVDVLISESLRLVASVDTNTPLKLTLQYNVDSVNASTFIYLCKARAMIRSFPGLIFSSYRQTATGSPVIVTMDQYYRMMKNMYDANPNRQEEMVEKPPKAFLRVMMKSGSTMTERETIMNGLRNFISDDLTSIQDSIELVASTGDAIDILNIFFILVSIIAVVLCFFVLWLSFTANVNENAWEFGVLRALGLNVSRVIRMYIYEALCLILSSVLIGSVIGLLVSITLTLQFNLFTELAFTFEFPYALFFAVFGMSLAVSIIGSWLPANGFKKKDIAIALKNM